MALYETLGLGGEKHPIVLDIGHAYTKAGFASEILPRQIIPTVTNQCDEELDYVIPKDETKLDKKELIGKLSKFFDHVFFKVLQINPKDKSILVCESLMNTTTLREAIAEVILTVFECSSIIFAPHHLLVCFTCAVDTALVVDTAVFETSALPIISGTPIIWAWQSSNIGAEPIHQAILSSLQKDAKIKLNDGFEKINFNVGQDILEDIKVRSCFVAPYKRSQLIANWKYSEEPDRKNSPLDFEYLLKDTVMLVPGYIREEAAEILFEKDNDKMSLPYLVLDTILQCPVDCRRSLAKNLIITGGTAFLPGLKHRILSEIQAIVSEDEKYKSLSACNFAIHKPPTHPNLTSWLGGSILASLESFHNKLISREYFIKNNKRLPDWCVLDIKPPELNPERPSTLYAGKKYLPYAPKLSHSSRHKGLSSRSSDSSSRESIRKSLGGLTLSNEPEAKK